MTHTESTRPSAFCTRIIAGTALLLALATPTIVVGGVIEVDQSKALAGGVTPSDAPGFPVTIDQPGSYRLTGSLQVFDPYTPAVEINSDNVTVDLNGFNIQGGTVCVRNNDLTAVDCTPSNTGSGHGIVGQGSAITVLNGAISGMGSFGILLTNGTGYRVQGVHVRSNGGAGIEVSNGSIVSNCTASLNGLVGFYCRTLGGNCTFHGNTARLNGGAGILLVGGVLSESHASINMSTGIHCTQQCTVINNTSTGNRGDGIRARGGSTVVGNTSGANKGLGLNLDASTGYANNVLTGNWGGTVLGGIEMGQNVCDGNDKCK